MIRKKMHLAKLFSSNMMIITVFAIYIYYVTSLTCLFIFNFLNVQLQTIDTFKRQILLTFEIFYISSMHRYMT
jgi:hypothetical protein